MSETSEDRTVWSTPRDREQAADALRVGMAAAREAAAGRATYRTVLRVLRVARGTLDGDAYAALVGALEQDAARAAAKDEQG